MTECNSIRELLPAYIDDELSPAQCEAAERHLELCPGCRQELEALEKDTFLLAATIGAPVAVGDRIADAVWAQIDAEDRAKAAATAPPSPIEERRSVGPEVRRRFSFGLPRQWAFGGGLAAAVAVMLLMFNLYQNRTGSPMDMQVASVTGSPLWRSVEAASWEPLTAGITLRSGDRIRTEDGERVTATWPDGSRAVLGPGGEGAVLRQHVGLELKRGQVWAKVQKRSETPFTVRTPEATAQVTGTEFAIEVPAERKRTILVVMEGAVQLFNARGSVTARDWSRTEAAANAAPTPPVAVSPLTQDSMWWVK